jgi:Sap-like sulfolipid-1-addressing protein
MERVFLLALTAALNPTLVAATTVMLLLANPSRLMLGYWLGAMMTSITLGCVILFALGDSSAVSTTKHTLSPAADLALGALALTLAAVIGTGRHHRLSERRARRKEGKEPPRWQRTLSKGTARTTFVVGALLTLPGASYLAGLDAIRKLGYSHADEVLLVVGFNLVMLLLLEGPLIAFAIAPAWTPRALERAKAWTHRHGRTAAAWGLAAVGVALVAKGIVGLL